MAPTDAEQLLLQATGRTELVDALEWVAEARALPKAPATHLLLQALTTLADSGEHAELAGQALKQYARPALRSRLDPSTELLLVDTLTMPASYKESLKEVARHTKSRTLKDITRVGTTRLPTSPRRTWTQAQVEGAFAVIDAVVRHRHRVLPCGSSGSPVEFVLAEPGASGGWDAVEAMRTGGVTYEVLLAQRVVGSAWGAHRNATGSEVQESVRAKLATLLDERNVPHEELRRDRRSRELVHLLFGDVRLDLTASLIIGSVPGVYLGARCSTRAPQGIIRRALVLVLVASGLKLVGLSTEVTGLLLLTLVAVGPLIWTFLRRRNGLPRDWRLALRDPTGRRRLFWESLAAEAPPPSGPTAAGQDREAAPPAR